MTMEPSAVTATTAEPVPGNEVVVSIVVHEGDSKAEMIIESVELTVPRETTHGIPVLSWQHATL